MVRAGVCKSFVGLSRQNCRFHVPLVAGRAKSSGRSCNRSPVAKESPVQDRRDKSPECMQISRVSPWMALSAQSFYAQPLQAKGIAAEI